MAHIEPATEADLAAITIQLGRVPRGLLGVAARCGSPVHGQDATDTEGQGVVAGSSHQDANFRTAPQADLVSTAGADFKSHPRDTGATPQAEDAGSLRPVDADFGTSPRDTGATPHSHPAVIATAPRLPNGEPFPTFYYLTCPEAVAACSRLEAAGVMREAEALLHDPNHPEIAAGYQRAHEAYLQDRNASLTTGEAVPEIANISAGGMPNRVKCFHAILGHRLAAGPGVNPIGDWLLDRLAGEGPWSPETCAWEMGETADEAPPENPPSD